MIDSLAFPVQRPYMWIVKDTDFPIITDEEIKVLVRHQIEQLKDDTVKIYQLAKGVDRALADNKFKATYNNLTTEFPFAVATIIRDRDIQLSGLRDLRVIIPQRLIDEINKESHEGGIYPVDVERSIEKYIKAARPRLAKEVSCYLREVLISEEIQYVETYMEHDEDGWHKVDMDDIYGYGDFSLKMNNLCNEYAFGCNIVRQG